MDLNRENDIGMKLAMKMAQSGLDPEKFQKLVEMQKDKIKVCQLCGKPRMHMGIFFPDKSEDFGGTAERQRMIFYGLCEKCYERDKGDGSLVENKIKGEIEVKKMITGDSEWKCPTISEYLKQNQAATETVKPELEPKPESEDREEDNNGFQFINPPQDIGEWNADWTLFDLAAKSGIAQKDSGKFYNDVLNNSLAEYVQTKDFVMSQTRILSSITEMLYISLNRPRWCVGRDMINLLSTMKYDGVEIRDVVFPYDCYTLIFPAGFSSSGQELRWVRVYRPKSELSLSIMKKWFNNRTEKETESLGKVMKVALLFQVCVGPRLEDLYLLPMSTENFNESISMIESYDDMPSGGLGVKLAISSALYYQCRPELVSNYSLPRNCRYNFKGHRENTRIINLPLMPKFKLVSKSDSNSVGSSPKRPHYRGWVIRVYRNERYDRNPDGSPKMKLIAPCAIHPEQME